jgi:hypothetical protein
MLPRVREFYGLEKLWEDTPPVKAVPVAVAVGAGPKRAPLKKSTARPRAVR